MEPISVKFPLTGEWCAVNTPGHKIPSHGTHMLGQTYAYDFFKIDWSSPKQYKFFSGNYWRYFLVGVPLNKSYCWGAQIIAPFSGEVVEAFDGILERNPIHLVSDIFASIIKPIFKRPENNYDLRIYLGNYIILKREDVFCLIAHAQCGSIKVKIGENVIEGQEIASVGHSGNSTAPHLHFQLMDRADLLSAKGLPCNFKSYFTFNNQNWDEIKNGIPKMRERIKA